MEIREPSQLSALCVVGILDSCDSDVELLSALCVVGILDSCDSDVELLSGTKDKLWQFGLYDMMLMALKQDFSKILDGWNTAAKLSHTLVYVLCFYFEAGQSAKPVMLST